MYLVYLLWLPETTTVRVHVYEVVANVICTVAHVSALSFQQPVSFIHARSARAMLPAERSGLNTETKGPKRATWKARSLYFWATLAYLWATLGHSGLSFCATWLSRQRLVSITLKQRYETGTGKGEAEAKPRAAAGGGDKPWRPTPANLGHPSR